MLKNPVLLLACVSGLAILAGCSGGAHTSTADPAAPTSAAKVAAATTPGYGAQLESAALKSADLKPGYQVELMTKGDQVTGQVTLDSCGYDYRSEANRVARRQYVVSHQGDPVGISNELVAYASAADAAAALTEFRTAVAHCAKTEGNDVSVQVLSARSADRRLPVPDNETVTFRQYDDAGHQEFDVMIFQRHGRYLDAVYTGQSTRFSASDTNANLALATTTGKRLVTLGLNAPG